MTDKLVFTNLPYVFMSKAKCSEGSPCILIVSSDFPPDAPPFCPFKGQDIEQDWILMEGK
jgi:hypothetical protein